MLLIFLLLLSLKNVLLIKILFSHQFFEIELLKFLYSSLNSKLDLSVINITEKRIIAGRPNLERWKDIKRKGYLNFFSEDRTDGLRDQFKKLKYATMGLRRFLARENKSLVIILPNLVFLCGKVKKRLLRE